MPSSSGDTPPGDRTPAANAPQGLMSGTRKKRRAPSMLDLIRLSPNDVRPPGGRSIYRQIALLADLGANAKGGEPLEVLDVPCGAGLQLAYLVGEFGVHGSGVDADEGLIGRANARARDLGVEAQLHFQDAPLDALPYRDAIFDLTIGELGLTSDVEPVDAVQELVRVTKPGGNVVLLQLVWKAPVEEGRRQKLIEHLGTRPLMLVEWKRLLKEAGVEELHTAEWSDEERPLRPTMAKPFPDFSQRFSVRERISILRKAWGLWGWRGVRDTLAREAEVHRLLTRERILGFVILKGTRVDVATEAELPPRPGPSGVPGDLPLFRAPGSADPPRPQEEDKARPASAPASEPVSTEEPEPETAAASAPTTKQPEKPQPQEASSTETQPQSPQADPALARGDVTDLPLFESEDPASS
jgi:ubiquinone/menaquinone biosynthesis C-methylase UbiE